MRLPPLCSLSHFFLRHNALLDTKYLSATRSSSPIAPLTYKLTAFTNAAEIGSMPIVHLLMSEHSPCLLAYSPSPSFTLSLSLSFSAGGGHNDTTKLLLEHGADVNVVVAATPEYIDEVAKAIAEGKEDVEPHKDGVTSLVVAAQGGHLGTVTMLVEAGAEVRVLDDEDMTPLLNAVKGDHAAVATYLVQHGADPNDGVNR